MKPEQPALNRIALWLALVGLVLGVIGSRGMTMRELWEMWP